MEFGVEKYIKQSNETINLWYSEPLTVVSSLVAGAQVAEVNYGEFGAKYILITSIILSSGIVAGAANLVTFTDTFNRVLFVMDISRDANGSIPMPRVLSTNNLRITATFQAPVVANYFFTVTHQYLREVDKKEKANF